MKRSVFGLVLLLSSAVSAWSYTGITTVAGQSQLIWRRQVLPTVGPTCPADYSVDLGTAAVYVNVKQWPMVSDGVTNTGRWPFRFMLIEECAKP